MQLSLWLRKTGTSVIAFAEQIGVTRGAVYSYIRKNPSERKIPSPETMDRISIATGKLVEPNDFYSCSADGGRKTRGTVAIHANPN